MASKTFLIVCAAVLFLAAPAAAQPPQKIPVLFDTDAGDDIDDALALALALASPELDVRGVTTVFGDAHTRAQLVGRLLAEADRKDIPVASATKARPQPELAGQMQYGLRAGRRNPLHKADAVTFLSSDRAGFITGQILYVDGGRVLV